MSLNLNAVLRAVAFTPIIVLAGCTSTTYTRSDLAPGQLERQRTIDEGRCTQESYASIPAQPQPSRVVVNTSPSTSDGGFADEFTEAFNSSYDSSPGYDTSQPARQRVFAGCMARLGWTAVKA